MAYEVVKSVVIGGAPVKVGKIVELEGAELRFLLDLGAVIEHEKPAPKAKAKPAPEMPK